ncbi:MAG TPA: DUF4369 domain-containing protein, partial [Flavobacterium sp.]|nr:DUF4369 domain-containing protein [Flavobacterium sp.]
VDTVKIENGKFVFKGSAKEPELYLVQVEKVQGKVPFILENGDIEMTINKDSVAITKVSGTYNNDELTSYKENGMKIQKKMMKFQEDNMAKMNQAQQKNDTVVMNSLRNEFKALRAESTNYMNNYPKEHPKSFISVLLVENMLNNPDVKVADAEKIFNSLEESLRKSAAGKKVTEAIATQKKK